MFSFAKYDRHNDDAEDQKVRAASDRHLIQLDRVLDDDDADEETIQTAIASAIGARSKSLPMRSARYGARVGALQSALTRRQLGGQARKFGSAREGAAFYEGLKSGGSKLVQIPFLFGSTLEYHHIVQAAAGAVTTDSEDGETASISYLDIDVYGVRLWAIYGITTAGCTLPYAYASLDSVKLEGGKSGIYGEQQMILDPHTADCGYCEMFIPIARGSKRMSAEQTAECTITLAANGTTRPITMIGGASLIGTAFER